MHAVFEHSRASGSNLLVLMAIADNADDEGAAYPKQETIARKARMSVRTVQRCIQDLRDLGELEYLRKDQRLNNNYIVVVAQLKGPAPTRQPDGSEPEMSGRDDTDVTSETSPDEDTRQVDGPGRQVGGDTVGGCDTTLVASHNSHITSTHTPRAREAFGPSLIPPGVCVQAAQATEKDHRPCHPDCCHGRNTTQGMCFPAVLVTRFASKLIGVAPDAAIADVLDWARNDRPPAGVADGDDFKHWRDRWNATRVRKTAPDAPKSSRAPGVAETDRYIDELEKRSRAS
jgi:hypothetical protein